MNDFLNTLRKDPSQVESYNTAVDLKRVGVALLILSVLALAISIGKPGNTIKYIGDAKVRVVECRYDEHYKPYRRGGNYENRKRKTYWAKFHGTDPDGDELTVTQVLSKVLYNEYGYDEWFEEDHVMKLYRSNDTGKMYLSTLEPEEALKEYQSINKGTVETACLYGGLLLLSGALLFIAAGSRMQRRARSYYRPINEFTNPYEEEAKRAEQQRMYDEAARIFDER